MKCQHNLVRLEEPPYSDECWFTTKACAYEPATILIAVHPDLPARSPEIIDMLRAWNLNIDRYQEAGRWRRANGDASINDTALWWLNNNVDVWTGWITPEAAEAIKSALQSNEVPDGWPTE